MGSLYIPNIVMQINPPPPPGTQVHVAASPVHLKKAGLNFPVIILPAQAGTQDREPEKSEASPVVVPAHLDTGASVSSIDTELAGQLGLRPVGLSVVMTAGGPCELPNYVIDLHFPGSTLSSFIGLPIGSAHLGFNLGNTARNHPQIGLLIGRDVMSRWNIVWNGPASAVTIND